MIRSLAATLGTDSSLIITKVHPSLNELSGLSKNISDSILDKLGSTVRSLEADKKARLEKVIPSTLHILYLKTSTLLFGTCSQKLMTIAHLVLGSH